MSDPAASINLAGLDHAQAFELDPQVWSATIAALRGEQPELAAELERTALPGHWRPAYALDGFASFRTEAPGQPAAWLADTAAPLARADGLLAGFHPGDYNPTLPAIAAGGELQRLLQHLPDYRAVYVFETELAALAAVLRVLVLAPAIAAGRCILVPPARAAAFLGNLLAAHPGLLPPGNIVCLPGVEPARIEELRQICERSAREVHNARDARLNELRAPAGPGPSSACTEPRVAVLALTPERTSRFASTQLAKAAQQLGWRAVRCAIDGPRAAHVLPHCQAVAALAPNLTICINHPAARLPLPLHGTVCQWVTAAADVPARLPDDRVLWLAASPRVAAALRAAAPSGNSIAEWYWGCDPAEPSSGRSPCRPPEDVVLLVADSPDDRPAACGIEQPSHRQLWRSLQEAAAQRWETQDILQPEALLAHAERITGARPADAAFRQRLLRLIEHALIPAAILRRIGQALATLPVRVQAVGRGWRRWSDPAATGSGRHKEIEPLAEYFFELPEWGKPLHPQVAIFAGPLDPLTPALLHAGAVGWPLLIHSPGRGPLTAALGHILHPEQHFQPFAGGAELRAAIQSICQNLQRTQRRTARTQQHLCDNHSYQRRLEDLARTIGSRPATPEA